MPAVSLLEVVSSHISLFQPRCCSRSSPIALAWITLLIDIHLQLPYPNPAETDSSPYPVSSLALTSSLHLQVWSFDAVYGA